MLKLNKNKIHHHPEHKRHPELVSGSVHKKPSQKGLNLTEMIISTAIFAIVMLSAANFSSQFFNVSAVSSKQLENVDQSRTIAESIAKEVTNAAYIYPAGVTISLSGYDSLTGTTTSFAINTDESPAMLFGVDIDDNISYGFVTYFFRTQGTKTSLYQFVQSPSYSWAKNTVPAESLLSFNGTISKLVEDIDLTNTQLNYHLNYANSITDEVLIGQIGGADTNDIDALVNGIDWEIAQENVEDQTIKIKGLSRNVPRFIE